MRRSPSSGLQRRYRRVARSIRNTGCPWPAQAALGAQEAPPPAPRVHRGAADTHRGQFTHHHDAAELDATGSGLHVAVGSKTALQRVVDLCREFRRVESPSQHCVAVVVKPRNGLIIVRAVGDAIPRHGLIIAQSSACRTCSPTRRSGPWTQQFIFSPNIVLHTVSRSSTRIARSGADSERKPQRAAMSPEARAAYS